MQQRMIRPELARCAYLPNKTRPRPSAHKALVSSNSHICERQPGHGATMPLFGHNAPTTRPRGVLHPVTREPPGLTKTGPGPQASFANRPVQPSEREVQTQLQCHFEVGSVRREGLMRGAPPEKAGEGRDGRPTATPRGQQPSCGSLWAPRTAVRPGPGRTAPDAELAGGPEGTRRPEACLITNAHVELWGAPLLTADLSRLPPLSLIAIALSHRAAITLCLWLCRRLRQPAFLPRQRKQTRIKPPHCSHKSTL